jgi:hypothetical protein
METFLRETVTMLEVPISQCAPSRLLQGGLSSHWNSKLLSVTKSSCRSLGHWQNPCQFGRLIYLEISALHTEVVAVIQMRDLLTINDNAAFEYCHNYSQTTDEKSLSVRHSKSSHHSTLYKIGTLLRKRR